MALKPTKPTEEASRRGRHSKQKGDAFQRKIAKLFATNFGQEFHSTPRSGGLRWQQRSDVIGDLVTPANFRFTIECKKHAEIDLSVLLQVRGANTTDDLIKWWVQSCDEAKRAGRLPLLVFEWNRGQPVAIIPHSAGVLLKWNTLEQESFATGVLCGALNTRISAVEEDFSQWADVRVIYLKDLFMYTIPHYWFTT